MKTIAISHYAVRHIPSGCLLGQQHTQGIALERAVVLSPTLWRTLHLEQAQRVAAGRGVAAAGEPSLEMLAAVDARPDDLEVVVLECLLTVHPVSPRDALAA